MEKLDWVQGVVLEALTGNSFLLKLNLIDDKQSNIVYHQIERIRMNGVEAPEMDSYEGILARNRLNTRLQNQKVHCDVIKREPDNYLLCTVKVLTS